MIMSSSKHEQRDESPFKDDRDRNPGIGKSKGSFATGEDPMEIEGENTVKGDVQNDARADGSVDPNQLGRTNE
jgi:hypothetical protein